MHDTPPLAAALFGDSFHPGDLDRLLPALSAASPVYYLGPPLAEDLLQHDGLRPLPMAADMASAIARLEQAGVGGDVCLIAADALLPAQALPRLLAWSLGSSAEVISPLGSGLALGLPLVAGNGSDRPAETIDQLCCLLAERVRIPTHHYLPQAALWRSSARQQLALGWPTLPAGQLPDAVTAECCPQMFVGRRGPSITGPALAEDPKPIAPDSPLSWLQLRIAAVASPPPCALPGFDGKPVILHVLHDWGGGVERFVLDLAAGDRQHTHLALQSRGQFSRRCYGESLRLGVVGESGFWPIRSWPLAATIADTVTADAGYRQLLTTLISDFSVSAVIVSSLIGHSLDALHCGLPTTFICHDYYPLWPVLHADFGDPSLAFDPASMASALAAADASTSPFQSQEVRHWSALREHFLDDLVRYKIALAAPSDCVRRNWLRIAPVLADNRFAVIPHGLRPFPEPPPALPQTQHGRLRLLVLGRIQGGKAEQLLHAAVADITRYADLYLLGCGAAGQAFFGQAHVHVLLDYDRAALPGLVATLQPDAALLPATVAESFSYTLSELWALGVPPIATRLGSFVERIADGVNGLLIAPNAAAIADLLSNLHADRSGLLRIGEHLRTQPATRISDARRAHFDLLGTLATPVAALIAATATTLTAPIQQLAAEQLRLESARQRLQQQLAEQIELVESRTEWALNSVREARSLRVQATELRATQQRLETTIEQREATIEQLDATIKQRTEWAKSLDQEVNRLGNELQLAQQRYQRLEQEKATADAGWAAEVARVEGLRQDLLMSTSWRITRPLRGIVSGLRNLRARCRYWGNRWLGLPPRVLNSLRSRGINGTIARVQQARPSLPTAIEPPVLTAVLTAPNSVSPGFTVPTSTAPLASIIIPVYNQFPYTQACLQSIAAHAGRHAFEVIVVDDCSSDHTRAGLARIGGIIALHNDRNLGFIGACNAGAARASGEFLLFLNNDTQVTKGWLDRLLDTFSEHPNVGLVGAKLVYPDGRLQEAGGIVFADASGWNYGRFADPSDPAFNYVREVDYCSGAAIAIRRALFEQLGGFDTRYRPAYYEDTDLAFQVRACGLRVLYQPAATVIHFEGITAGTDTGAGIKRYQVVNQQTFAERWRTALAQQPRVGTTITLAREHRARGRLLMIDATTPEPDKDSGSVRLVNLFRALIELGWKVTFTTENRAYCAGYTERLQQLGVEVLYHPWIGDPVNFFKATGSLWQVVILSRHYVAGPLLPLVRQYAPHAQLVFDTVDLHYLREQRAAELAQRPDLVRSAAKTQLAELRLVRACDLTLVVSPVEQALLRQEVPGARIEVLSNVHAVVGSRRSFGERRDLFFVGGFQHQPNVDAMHWFVADIWPLIAERLPGACFHIVGSRMPASITALASDRVLATGFVESLDAYLDGCRLSVAPLRFGAGVKGKVNQSMAYGQPVVATTLAAEGMYLQPEADVLIADTAADFAAQVLRLYQDEALWQRLSQGGLANVEQHFSFAAAKQALSGCLTP